MFQLDGNFPPERRINTFEYVALVYNNASLHIPEDYAIDPEGMIVGESVPRGLPNFLLWRSSIRTITGIPVDQNLGDYFFSMTVEDDYGH